MPPRIERLLDEPIGFAHRGARAHERENTVAAFELALRLGATGLESDVWITADGDAVLDHDGLVRRFGRLGRSRRLADLTRRALPGHIPTVEELFDAVGLDYELSLDVKDEAAMEPLVAAIERADPSPDGFKRRVWICHPRLDALIEWRDRWPDLRYVHSLRLPRFTSGVEVHAAAVAAAGIDAMNMHYSDWTGGLTTLFHRFGVLAFGWDAQHERVLRELIDIGCDAVYSDHVDRMVAVMDGSEPTDVVQRPDA